MKGRQGGDASFLIGLMLGLVVGAAVVFVLSSAMSEESMSRLEGEVREAADKLESKADDARARVQGAAEGLSGE